MGNLPEIKQYLILSYLKNNYRSIALVTAASKFFELCHSIILKDYLVTHNQQFRFKRKHSTDLCIFTVKSVTKYYTQKNSQVFTCFLDASKAFDKINILCPISKVA